MKATALATCAVATFGLVAIANPAQAQSNEEILRRLEAKIDSLSKENTALRDRVKRIEGSRQTQAAPVRVAALGTTSDAPQVGLSNEARAARADGMPLKAVPYARPSCAQFGGWYVGGNVGWGVYDTRFSDRDGLNDTVDTGLPDNVDARKQGVTAGVQGGYNWQSGCSLFGIESDWSWSGLKTSEFNTDGDVGAVDTMTVENKLRWFGTTRARAGVVVDNLLLYVTGGLAYANVKRNFTYFQDGPAHANVFSSNNTKIGWTAGVGAEWALANNWTLKGEFLYMSFEGDRITAAGDGVGIGNAGVNYRLDSNDSVWVSRIGLNYRFGGDLGKGPVVAKY